MARAHAKLPLKVPLRVALLGLGTVGGEVARRLTDDAWLAAVRDRGLLAPELVAVGVRDPHRPRAVDLPSTLRRTDRLDGLVADPSVDVVIELMGGLDRPAGLVERALSAGKHVVTANKAMLAAQGPVLEAAARAAGVALRFEAAAAGGIPVLAPLVADLAANRIREIRGIVNGTTNFILTAMSRDGRSYADALAQARARGYAEADPSGDVEGRDAADKLAILARLAFGAWPDVRRIGRSAPALHGASGAGIMAVDLQHVRAASRLGLAIKLVARARRVDHGVDASVMPMAVPSISALGVTDGVTNIVEIVAEPVGVVSFRGPGAGGPATSSAVLADVLAITRGEGSTWGPLPEPSEPLEVTDPFGSPRAWLVVSADDADPLAERLSAVVRASAGPAVVTHPLPIGDLRALLRGRDVDVAIYPLLTDD